MLELKAKARTIYGKQLKKAREAGDIPAVVYGAKEQTKSIFVIEKDFLKAWETAGETSVIKLDVDGVQKDVLIQEVALHPVSDKPIHIDFYAVSADEKLKVSIPLVFSGVAGAVKTYNAILVKVMHEVEVEALPADLPRELTADLSALANIGDQILVKDIKMPKGVVAMAGADDVVALVSAAKEEKEEEVAPAADLTKIEVEKKGKKEEEGAPAAAAATPAKK